MKDRDLFIGLFSLLVGLFGTAGTYFQIFGSIIFVLPIMLIGYGAALYYLIKIILEWRAIAKTFGERWRMQDGQLIIGNTVNVALRTQTVQQLFDAFAKANPENYKTLLKNSGKVVGQGFVEDLIRELTQKGIEAIAERRSEPDILKSKLKLWAQYDSSTGIGIFNVENVEIAMNGIEGEITLANSFLANDKVASAPSCIFLEGYMEGVLSRLLNLPISINESHCSSVTRHNICKFKVSQ